MHQEVISHHADVKAPFQALEARETGTEVVADPQDKRQRSQVRNRERSRTPPACRDDRSRSGYNVGTEIAIRTRENQDDKEKRMPAFLREEYGRTAAGPIVLRGREREDYAYSEWPGRRPPSSRRITKGEDIIVRPDATRRPPQSRPSINIRNESEAPRPRRPSMHIPVESEAPPQTRPRLSLRDVTREQEEIITRRDERPEYQKPAPRYRERGRSPKIHTSDLGQHPLTLLKMT